MAALTAWLFAVGTLLFLYAVVSKRLSTTIVTGPMLFVTVGLTIRMIPVALGMIGSGLNRVSVLYLGWFGPRGLASIIFAGSRG